MGGDRETFVETVKEEKKQAETNPPSTMGSVGSSSGSRIRIHENAGEVHFHDDAAKLKVTVPVAVWYKEWKDLSANPHRKPFPDKKNNTTLAVETKFDNGKWDAIITLLPYVESTNYSELDKFTVRK